MKAVLVALGALLTLPACETHSTSFAVATPMAAADMPVVGRHEQAVSLYIGRDIVDLRAPFRYNFQQYKSDCTATVAAGDSLQSAIESVTRAAFASVTRGGGLAQPVAGVDRHIAVQFDSLTMPPAELVNRSTYFDAEADVDLQLRVSVYDGSGRLLLRRPLAATGHGQIKQVNILEDCAAASDVESKAIGNAISRVMQAYAKSVLDAPELRTTTTE